MNLEIGILVSYFALFLNKSEEGEEKKPPLCSFSF